MYTYMGVPCLLSSSTFYPENKKLGTAAYKRVREKTEVGLKKEVELGSEVEEHEEVESNTGEEKDIQKGKEN